jgi:hypothetical protein
MFQTPKIFDLEKEKSNSGMFSSTWFYFTIMTAAVIFLLLFIVLIHTL